MDDYLCVTLLAHPGEAQAAFKSRLVAFWTHMLRNRPDDYEKIYSEAVEFEMEEGQVSRLYMVEPGVLAVLRTELAAHGIALLPVDETDTYSKAEASSPDWFQVEH